MCTKRQVFQDSIENLKKSTPCSTEYINIGQFVCLKSACCSEADIAEYNPFGLDTTDLQTLEASLCYISVRNMNFWLIKFIQKARSIGLVSNRLFAVFTEFQQIQFTVFRSNFQSRTPSPRSSEEESILPLKIARLSNFYTRCLADHVSSLKRFCQILQNKEFACQCEIPTVFTETLNVNISFRIANSWVSLCKFAINLSGGQCLCCTGESNDRKFVF